MRSCLLVTGVFLIVLGWGESRYAPYRTEMYAQGVILMSFGASFIAGAFARRLVGEKKVKREDKKDPPTPSPS